MMFSGRASTTGVWGRSTRRKTIPVLGPEGRMVIVTSWPVCSPTPEQRIVLPIVFCRPTPTPFALPSETKLFSIEAGSHLQGLYQGRTFFFVNRNTLDPNV